MTRLRLGIDAAWQIRILEDGDIIPIFQGCQLSLDKETSTTRLDHIAVWGIGRRRNLLQR